MIKNKKGTYLSFAVMLVVSALLNPAYANRGANPIGSVNATIDGRPYEGKTLEIPSAGTATVEFQSMGSTTLISLQAHDPQAKKAMHNVLSIEMTVTGEGPSAAIVPGAVAWWPNGMRGAFYINEGKEADTRIQISALSLHGGGQVEGHFAATLCRKDSMFAAADPNECIPIEGSFETRLGEAG